MIELAKSFTEGPSEGSREEEFLPTQSLNAQDSSETDSIQSGTQVVVYAMKFHSYSSLNNGSLEREDYFFKRGERVILSLVATQWE